MQGQAPRVVWVALGPACLSSPSWRCGHVVFLPSLAPIAGVLRGDTESLWGTHTLVSPTDLSPSRELCNPPSLRQLPMEVCKFLMLAPAGSTGSFSPHMGLHTCEGVIYSWQLQPYCIYIFIYSVLLVISGAPRTRLTPGRSEPAALKSPGRPRTACLFTSPLCSPDFMLRPVQPQGGLGMAAAGRQHEDNPCSPRRRCLSVTRKQNLPPRAPLNSHHTTTPPCHLAP